MDARARREQITICDYDARWPQIFADEQVALRLVHREHAVLAAWRSQKNPEQAIWWHAPIPHKGVLRK